MKRVDGSMSYTPCRRHVREIKLAPEVSVNLKRWVPWETFSALPPTLQKLYLQTQVEKYRVGAAALGKAWGKSAARMCQVLDELGIERPRYTQHEDEVRFLEFVRVGHEVPAEDK